MQSSSLANEQPSTCAAVQFSPMARPLRAMIRMRLADLRQGGPLLPPSGQACHTKFGPKSIVGEMVRSLEFNPQTPL